MIIYCWKKYITFRVDKWFIIDYNNYCKLKLLQFIFHFRYYNMRMTLLQFKDIIIYHSIIYYFTSVLHDYDYRIKLSTFVILYYVVFYNIFNFSANAISRYYCFYYIYNCAIRVYQFLREKVDIDTSANTIIIILWYYTLRYTQTFTLLLLLLLLFLPL